MPDVKSVTVVTRSFQGRATDESFDKAKFKKVFVEPISRLIRGGPYHLKKIMVVSAADPSSPAGEVVGDDGKTPTMRAVEEFFPDEIASGRVATIACSNWGLNFGSATALNAGLEHAVSEGSDAVLMWSPEIQLTGHRVSLMIDHMEQFGLSLCGYAREGWTERKQWTFVQNTIALWRIQTLTEIGGFDSSCNGDGKTTVATKEFGSVPLAGMEDYHAYLRASSRRGEMLRWGFVGVSDPAFWDISAKLPGTEEWLKNEQKVARQTLVMEEWARQIFPDRNPLQVWRDVSRKVRIK